MHICGTYVQGFRVTRFEPSTLAAALASRVARVAHENVELKKRLCTSNLALREAQFREVQLHVDHATTLGKLYDTAAKLVDKTQECARLRRAIQIANTLDLRCSPLSVQLAKRNSGQAAG